MGGEKMCPVVDCNCAAPYVKTMVTDSDGCEDCKCIATMSKVTTTTEEGVSVCQQDVFASCDEVMNEVLSEGLSSGSCASKGVTAECKDSSMKINGDCSETTKTEVDVSFYVTE